VAWTIAYDLCVEAPA